MIREGHEVYEWIRDFNGFNGQKMIHEGHEGHEWISQLQRIQRIGNGFNGFWIIQATLQQFAPYPLHPFGIRSIR